MITRNQALKSIDSETFSRMISEPKHRLDAKHVMTIDLLHTVSNLLFNLVVSSVQEIDIQSTFKINVKITSFGKNDSCLVQLSDKNLENMLILGKNSVLCDFSRSSSNIISITFEIILLRTGMIKIPEILVTPVDRTKDFKQIGRAHV